MTEERIHKYLARCGVGSRRACEELVQAGRVTVDGQVVSQPGFKLVPGTVRVEVDGRPVEPGELVHYLVNKPPGYICSNRPVGKQPRVVSLLKRESRRVFPVGRLDVESRGLVLLTNDGDLAYRLTHPRFEVERTYRVKVRGRLEAAAIKQLEAGVVLEDGPTLPARVERVRVTGQESQADVTLREGRKRQVRRMFQAVGHRVEDLVRIRMGPLELGSLPEGHERRLTEAELAALRRATR